MTFEEWFGKDLTGQTFEGSIWCSENGLTSLKGCPSVVIGAFDCSYNDLKTLEHGPKKVEGNFYCSGNNLTSLEHGPEFVSYSYYCTSNNLVTLDGVCFNKNIVSDFSRKVVQEYLMKHYPEMMI